MNKNTQEPTTNDNPYKGVIVHTAGMFNNDILALLNKGKNFKITPSSMENEAFKIKVATERLACAIRYAHPFFEDTTKVQDRPSISKQVIRFYQKDSHAPYHSNSETEKKIKNFKHEMYNLLPDLKKTHIPPNITKGETQALKEIKQNPHIKVELSDKTNKMCLMDKSFMDIKINELQNNSSFTKISSDPTKKTEKEGNKLLEEIFEEIDDTISPALYKHLYSSHSTIPEIFSFQKDHKDSYPNTKVRAVMPGKGSAVEKMDILISKVLGQISPFLKFRVFNAKEFQDKIKNVNLPKEKFMFSLDVAEMYPTLPTNDEALKITLEYLTKYQDKIDLFGFQPIHIILLLKFVLNNTYIMIGGNTSKCIWVLVLEGTRAHHMQILLLIILI